MVFGIIFRGVNILFPFINRTAVLYILGNSYLGLNSLFSSILGILNLAELGVGSAIVYSMYKPIAVSPYVSVHTNSSPKSTAVSSPQWTYPLSAH